MDEKNYNKRELDHYFKDINCRLDTQDVILQKIMTQTTETNGGFKLHKVYFKIIWIALGILGTVLLSISPDIVKFIKKIYYLSVIIETYEK